MVNWRLQQQVDRLARDQGATAVRPVAAAGTVLGGDAGRAVVPPDTDWFPVRITTALTGPARYLFAERWLQPDETWADKPGGRANTAEDYAYPLSGTFAVDAVALCRRSEGAGGQKWELTPSVPAGSLFVGAAATLQTLSTDDTWTDITGAVVTLPADGKYLIYAHVVASGRVDSTDPAATAVGGYLFVRWTRVSGASRIQVGPTVPAVVIAGGPGTAASGGTTTLVTAVVGVTSEQFRVQVLRSVPTATSGTPSWGLSTIWGGLYTPSGLTAIGAGNVGRVALL